MSGGIYGGGEHYKTLEFLLLYKYNLLEHFVLNGAAWFAS